jgi:hypothetical protein
MTSIPDDWIGASTGRLGASDRKLGMQTTADPLPLAHAYLRLAEGADHPPAPRLAAALIALVVAVVLTAATPVLWTSAAHSGTDRPSATLPGKVGPAFDADDAPDG